MVKTSSLYYYEMKHKYKLQQISDHCTL